MIKLKKRFFQKSQEEVNHLLCQPELTISNSHSNSSIITFNYTIDDSEIYKVIFVIVWHFESRFYSTKISLFFFKAITTGDKEFFYFSSLKRNRILQYRFMDGNCFLLAVKYLQKDICHILATLYGFGIHLKNINFSNLYLVWIFF